MPNYILRDVDAVRNNLLPLTFTRPVALLRVGILTLLEKWQRDLPGDYSFSTVDYLSRKYPTVVHPHDNIVISSHILPSPALIRAIQALEPGEGLRWGDELIARRGAWEEEPTSFKMLDEEPRSIRRLYEIFGRNDEQLIRDFVPLTRGRRSQPISSTCTVIGDRKLIFIEEGATVEGAILNTRRGPIYVGPGAEIMEGACIRGGLAMLEGSVVNMGAKIYGATTLGPYSKVGGELNNVVIIGYSNKAHDGFLGNAVIGEWCNLGGGTTASNLKNDYTEIKLWNYPARRFLKTGLQFCGLIMGDHSKTGINTMLNTATVLGVGVNIHGSGFPRNFVASFTEGSPSGYTDVDLHKFFEVARRVMARRHKELTEVDIDLYEALHSITEQYK
ncbi:MAG: glucose-1-phosphate thymidylyltransferase [Bacteroidales bacterium]|nr:glucose-1-phosphate thymidylyltransferase [Bacteroidales bacterium]